MNTQLQQLRDIHLPPAINMAPIAPGWLVLYALVASFIGYLIYHGYKTRLRKYTAKFAMAKLAKLKELSADNPENINIAAEISTLIRRTALYYFRRIEVAGLAGNDWLNFLNRSDNTNQFTDATGRLLIDAPYRKTAATDLAPLFALTQSWLIAISKKSLVEK